MSAVIIRSNALALPLADESVDLVVTSPPYFGLRSYQDGGEHYDGQIGAEATPAEFVDALIAATREMVRVLKPSGSIWVNLGDKYAGQGTAPVGARRAKPHPAIGEDYSDRSAVAEPGFSSDQYPSDSSRSAQSPQYPSQPSPYSENSTPQSRHFTMSSNVGPVADMRQGARDGNRRSRPAAVAGIPGKSLMGVPWRYALRCIDDLGLILRAEVIWSKPNGLPESVTDRVRRSHETWFHFTRSPRYYSAVDEIREAHVASATGRDTSRWRTGPSGQNRGTAAGRRHDDGGRVADFATSPLGKLPGSVWSIPTQPLKVPAELGIDHFAAFPMEWPRRIIQGWSPAGVCVECGEGRRPVAERTAAGRDRATTAAKDPSWQAINRADWQENVTRTITGYACACPEPTADTTPGVVLDPFGGTGTTALVAKAYGRDGISVDMSADYCRLARWRTSDPGEIARAMEVDKPAVQVEGQISMLELDFGEAG